MKLTALLCLLIFCLALVPRVVGLADFLTTDEAYHWIERTERFAAALAEGRWAATNQTGHPGVTLMWLGSLGLHIERTAINLGWVAPPDRLQHLAWLRLVPATFHALVLVLAYLMLRRLLSPTVALVAALLWATSPYLVAHGRLLHLDATLTDFVTLALLATMLACRSSQSLPWLLAAGCATGLALLTKGPALIALPVLGLVLFFLGEQGDKGTRGQSVSTAISDSESPLVPPSASAASGLFSLPWLTRRLRWSIPRYLLLLTTAGVVIFCCWPALWNSPGPALARYVEEIIGNGGRPNGDGQFFLGQAIADPGPWFYPLANLYRLAPLELLGLVGLLIALVTRHSALVTRRSSLVTLAAFIAFWTLVMIAGPKKFDRYVLPTWPALLILAAVGLHSIGLYAKSLFQRSSGATLSFAVALTLLTQLPILLWYHPYYLSYYNPLLGGSSVAQNLFLIGWGEGMDRVGAYLRSRPDLGEGQVVSALPPTLQPFLPVPVQNVTQIDQANPNYAVVYLESIQRAAEPAIYERIRATVPLTTISIHGIDYAQIYQLPRPFTKPLQARFGPNLGLPGITVERSPGALVLTPAWDVRGPIGGDYLLFVHLLDSNGQRVAEVAVPPGGAARPPTSQWQSGEQIAVPIPMSLPASLPPGEYALVGGLFDLATGARLPLSAGPVADPALAGNDALLLDTITIGP
jgi:4-amino-4-deoxy-L-arabinose transferase-like glycosyltransferase